MAIRGLGHLNLRAPAAMIERLRRFYVDLVGLREGPRPVFRSGSRGHWLYAGERDVMHLTIAAIPKARLDTKAVSTTSLSIATTSKPLVHAWMPPAFLTQPTWWTNGTRYNCS